MLKKIYHFGQILIYASLFLPLVIHDAFVFPFITPRNFLFRFLMSLGLVVLIILWLNLKELRPRKNWLNIAVVSVIVAKFLSAIFGVSFYNSFWSNYERMEGVLAWLFFGIFYFLLTTVFQKRQEWRWLLRISLFPALLVAFYGMAQAWGWDVVMPARQSRIEAQLGNAAYVGAYMVIHIGISLYLSFRDKNIWWRIFSSASLLPFHLALFYSATRGAGLGWIVGILVGVVFYLFFAKDKKIRFYLVGAFLAFIFLLGGIWLARDSGFVQEKEFLRRMTSINFTEGTVNSRLMIWNMAWQGFKQKPVFGWGQDNFNYIYNLYYNDKIGEAWVDRAHNNLFDQLSMGGVVNFAAYLSVIIFPFVIFFRWRRHDVLAASLLIALWSAYVVQNQFVFDSLNTYIYFFIILAFALFLQKKMNLSDKSSAEGMMAQYSASYNYWILTLLFLLAVIVNLVFSWPGFKANTLTISSLEEKYQNPQAAYEKLEQAIELDSFGSKEISLQTTTFAYHIVSEKNLSDAFKTKVVLFSVNSLEKAVEREPNDVRVLMTLASMYRTASVLDVSYIKKAEDVLKNVIELSPGRLGVYYDLADISYSLGDYEAAENYLFQAYSQDQNNRQTLVNLAHFLSSRFDERALSYADRLVQFEDGYLTERDLAVIADVYFQFEKWEQAANFSEKLIKQNPDNPVYWQQLGQAYQALGNTADLPRIDEELKRLDANPLSAATSTSAQ